MQTKTSQVQVALAKCAAWNAADGEDVRLLSERAEELWFQIDDLACALQEAENRGNTAETERSLSSQKCIPFAQEQQIDVTGRFCYSHTSACWMR